VQVRSDGASRRADLGHPLPARDALPGRHPDRAAVRVERRRPVRVQDDQQVPVAADAVVRVDHQPIARGADRLALLGHDVDSVVRPVVDLAAAHAPEAAAEEPSRDGPEEIVAVGHAFELRDPFVVRATDPETVRRDP